MVLGGGDVRVDTSNVVATNRIETIPAERPPDPAVADAVELLTAVADPSRLAILRILTAGPQCVCHLQTEIDIPANLLSYHLKVLRGIGLIHGVRRGRWIDYHLATDAAARLHEALPLPCPAEADVVGSEASVEAGAEGGTTGSGTDPGGRTTSAAGRCCAGLGAAGLTSADSGNAAGPPTTLPERTTRP
jgi:ArsR family transcriptional regulator, arsenate/arsenite/antimonite-responsive transcriptional repressor